VSQNANEHDLSPDVSSSVITDELNDLLRNKVAEATYFLSCCFMTNNLKMSQI